MAQPVYSQRLYAHASQTSADGTLGPVVPAGFVYVLRDVDLFCSSGLVNDVLWIENQVGGILIQCIVTSSPFNTDFAWRGRQVYAPGETVGFQVGTGTWAVAASGYALTLP
jgi:hypothetical protein